MVKRKIINIDEEKCNGCGVCIPNCPEGAIQIIDGKARLISDIFCDGLGACIGHCPQDAISTEEREAEEYSERKTMENIIKAGPKTIIAHLKHLKDHGEMIYYNEAMDVLKEKEIEITIEDDNDKKECKNFSSCPGSKVLDFSDKESEEDLSIKDAKSKLRQWPIQLHLVPPNAPYFQLKDVILVADCVGYSIVNFHEKFLKNRSISIACPKLDSNIDIYLSKIISLIDDSKINTLTVMTMEVPCCSGLLNLAKKAVYEANRKIPIKSIVVSIKGDILREEWL
jgi:Pyruvate/2-oxoacid:ferredoxin oxidoreductase delta subunit